MRTPFTFLIAVVLLCACQSPEEQEEQPNTEETESIEKTAADTLRIYNSMRAAEITEGLYQQFKAAVVYQSVKDGADKTVLAQCNCELQPPPDSFYTSAAFRQMGLTFDLVQAMEKKKADICNTVIAHRYFNLAEEENYSFWTDSLFTRYGPDDPLTAFKDRRMKDDNDKSFRIFAAELHERLSRAFPQLGKAADNNVKLFAGETTQKSQAATKSNPVAPPENNSRPGSPPWMLWTSIAALLCSIAGLCWLFMVSRKLQRQEEFILQTGKRIESRIKKNEVERMIEIAIERNQHDERKENPVYHSSLPHETISETPTSFTPAPLPQKRFLYFANPLSNGTFMNTSGRNSIDESGSIYEFELDENGSTAIFRVLESPQAAKIATGTAERALLPVCKYEAGMPDRVNRIRTSTPGKATLEGDRWIVVQRDKAIIRFE